MSNKLENARKRLNEKDIDIEAMKYVGKKELKLTQGDYSDILEIFPHLEERRTFLLTVMNESHRISEDKLFFKPTFSKYEKSLSNGRATAARNKKLEQFNATPLNIQRFGYYPLDNFKKSTECQTDIGTTDIDLWQKGYGTLQNANEKLEKKRNEMHNFKRLHKRHETKHSKKMGDLIDKHISEIEEYEDIINEYKTKLENAEEDSRQYLEEIKTLEDENKALKSKIEELEKPKTEVVEIFKGGKYIDKAVYAIAQLKQCYVSDEKCGEVIKICFSIVDLLPNKLPSRKTVARFNFVTKALINEQLREILLSAARRGVPATLSTDETSKLGHKFETFEYRTVDENGDIRDFCMGMPETTDKSAVTCIQALEYSVKQLETESIKGNIFWEKFILSVEHTMSDKAATEIKKKALLEAEKKLLIEADARFDHLNVKEKEDLAKIKAFFCQLHMIQNSTTVLLAAALEYEKETRADDKLAEAVVYKLIKACPQYMGERAASHWGVHPKWILYAKNNNIKFPHIPDFKGHRFNIVLAIAESVFYLSDHILKFMEDHKTKLNEVPIRKKKKS